MTFTIIIIIITITIIIIFFPRCQVRSLSKPEVLFNTLMALLVQLASHGLVHCDFNEFNIIISNEDKPTLIDFPQMVSTSHPDAARYY